MPRNRPVSAGIRDPRPETRAAEDPANRPLLSRSSSASHPGGHRSPRAADLRGFLVEIEWTPGCRPGVQGSPPVALLVSDSMAVARRTRAEYSSSRVIGAHHTARSLCADYQGSRGCLEGGSHARDHPHSGIDLRPFDTAPVGGVHLRAVADNLLRQAQRMAPRSNTLSELHQRILRHAHSRDQSRCRRTRTVDAAAICCTCGRNPFKIVSNSARASPSSSVGTG
jgi:hypothetical protein